jgi:hypothetical protein
MLLSALANVYERAVFELQLSYGFVHISVIADKLSHMKSQDHGQVWTHRQVQFALHY